MKKLSKRTIIIIALITSMVLVCTSSAITHSSVYEEVIKAEDKLEDVLNQLENVTGGLTAATISMSDMSDEINEKNNTIININVQLVEKTEKLNVTTVELTQVLGDLSLTKQQLEENVSKIGVLQNGTKYDMHDPLYSEVVSFLINDTTDSITYNAPIFNCNDFSAMVNNNAESLGIRCAVVCIFFYGAYHVIVGFDTLDNGMMYVEPQTDEWVNLMIGKEYWAECVIGDHTDPSYNDTIRRFSISW